MIDSLAYVGFSSPHAAEWRTFGPEILGLQVVDRDDDTVLLRNDEAVWRIAIHPASTNDLAYFGWAVGGPTALRAAAERLGLAGIEVHPGDDRLAAERGVAALAWFHDPFGFRHELIHGQKAAVSPFKPGRRGVSFVTGAQGLGHVVLFVPDWDAATAFFVDVLGFRVSDDIEMGIKVRFLHCNSRHHSLAFSAIPGMRGVHHLMLEVSDPDEVGRAYDLAREQKLPVTMTLGRHTNDGMFSFYVRCPSGFEIEYGSGGRLIDTETVWQQGYYDAMSVWGHQRSAEHLPLDVLHPVGARVRP